MRNPFLLADDQMMRLQLSYPKSRRKPREDDRRGLSGIIFIKGNSLRWFDASVDYGPRKTLCNRWSNMGLFARIMTGPASEIPDRQTNSVDVTCFKIHRTASSLGLKKQGPWTSARTDKRSCEQEGTCHNGDHWSANPALNCRRSDPRFHRRKGFSGQSSRGTMASGRPRL